jgi:hypothetical protein
VVRRPADPLRIGLTRELDEDLLAAVLNQSLHADIAGAPADDRDMGDGQIAGFESRAAAIKLSQQARRLHSGARGAARHPAAAAHPGGGAQGAIGTRPAVAIEARQPALEDRLQAIDQLSDSDELIAQNRTLVRLFNQFVHRCLALVERREPNTAFRTRTHVRIITCFASNPKRFVC